MLTSTFSFLSIFDAMVCYYSQTTVNFLRQLALSLPSCLTGETQSQVKPTNLEKTLCHQSQWFSFKWVMTSQKTTTQQCLLVLLCTLRKLTFLLLYINTTLPFLLCLNDKSTPTLSWWLCILLTEKVRTPNT